MMNIKNKAAPFIHQSVCYEGSYSKLSTDMCPTKIQWYFSCCMSRDKIMYIPIIIFAVSIIEYNIIASLISKVLVQ